MLSVNQRPTKREASGRLRGGGCWNIPGDPARDAIAASDGLDGRDCLGSGGNFRHKKGRPRRAARTGLGEKLADGLGRREIKGASGFSVGFFIERDRGRVLRGGRTRHS